MPAPAGAKAVPGARSLTSQMAPSEALPPSSRLQGMRGRCLQASGSPFFFSDFTALQAGWCWWPLRAEHDPSSRAAVAPFCWRAGLRIDVRLPASCRNLRPFPSTSSTAIGHSAGSQSTASPLRQSYTVVGGSNEKLLVFLENTLERDLLVLLLLIFYYYFETYGK